MLLHHIHTHKISLKFIQCWPKQISILERRDYSASKDPVTQSEGLDGKIRLAPLAISSVGLELEDDPAQSMSLPSYSGEMAQVDPKALEADDVLVDSQFVWEDDFGDRDITAVPSDVARRMVDLAIKQQEALRKAYISVRRVPAEQLGNLTNIEVLNDLRKKCINGEIICEVQFHIFHSRFFFL